jgi:gliding motility-associated-like protein
VSAAWAANTITISGTPTASGTFNYTIPLTGGCGVADATGSIIVSADNTIALSSAAGSDNQSVCINTAISDITYTTTGATGATFSGLPAGVTGVWIADVVTINGTPTLSGTFNYTVTLTGGCGSITTNGVILVTTGNTITLSSAAGTDNQTTCINTSITDITYSTTGATGATFTGLPAGVTGTWAADVVTITGISTEAGTFNYTITLTGGCDIVTSSGTINVTPPPSLVVNDPSAVCSPATVDITDASVTSGSTAGLTLSYWSDASATIPYATPATASSGTYYIKGEDGTGCFDIKPVVVTVNPVPTASITVINVGCFGESTGQADLTVSGGTGPYTFLWNNGDVSEDLTGIVAGNYMVIVTDANSCTATASETITEPVSALTGSITSQTNVSVNGGNDGSVTVDGSGGTPGYQYSLNGGTYQVSGTFSTLTAGSYTVTVQDGNLCTYDVPVTITQPALALSGTITSQINMSCFGVADGSVTVTGEEGYPPYEYSLDGGTYQASGTFGGLTAGLYVVTVRDASSNTYDVPVTITQPVAPLAVSTTQTDVLCAGAATGTATAVVSGGTAPYSYSWNTTPVQTLPNATGLVAGSYTLTVTDANGCIVSTNITITQPAAITVTTTKTDVSCNGGNNGAATAVTAGGTGPYGYSWNTTPVQSTSAITGLSAGSYTVTVTDGNGCTSNATVQITEPAALSLSATLTEAGCPDSPDGSVTLTITGGTAPYGIFWADGSTTQNRSGLLPGNYSVVVTDASGCAASLNVEITYSGSFKCLVIPQIITPNNDGYNDEWRIRNIDIYPDAEVRVFNRWGRLVFRTKNISANPWNGTSNGKPLPTDSYHYILNLNDGSEPRSGVISIIR